MSTLEFQNAQKGGVLVRHVGASFRGTGKY
jgi:hypothetical protein